MGIIVTNCFQTVTFVTFMSTFLDMTKKVDIKVDMIFRTILY